MQLPVSTVSTPTPTEGSPIPVPPPARVHAAEAVEAAAWRSLYEDLPADVVTGCGLDLVDLGPGVAGIASRVDALAFNRVHGPELAERLDDRALDRLIRRYREAGARRFFVQLCPGTPDLLVRRLEARGFRLYNRWVKLWRGPEPPPEASTGLRLERIGPEGAEPFGAIVRSAFGWAEPVERWMAALVGRPGWRHYLAFDGDEPVAAGGLFLAEGWAWLGPAATLPGHRRRGAQQALLERRMRDALALGARAFSVETAEDRPDRPVASYRNLVRAGFELAYARPNYLLEL